MNNYYVYIYWRLDTNEPFYIGKGRNRRWLEVYDTHRNKYFMRIANKHPIVCEIIKDNLTEEQAHGIECWIINELVFEYGYSIDIPNNRSSEKGFHLVNCTWGGEGISGCNPFENKTEEELEKWKERISENSKELWKNKEHREKMSNRMKGENNPQYGKHPTEETRNRMRESHKGKCIPKETKIKMSKANKGKHDWKNNSKARSVICLTTKRIFFTVEEAKEYYGIKSNGGIIECCKGKKFYKGKWHKVKYAGKLPDGTKLVWKRLRWRHNKKYRVKIHGR